MFCRRVQPAYHVWWGAKGNAEESEGKSRPPLLHDPNMHPKARYTPTFRYHFSALKWWILIWDCVGFAASSLIFSFTNGVEWDGPYRLQFQVPKAWRNKPTEFFTEGLAEELSREGACEEAIFPDTNVVATSCAMVGNLTVEGVSHRWISLDISVCVCLWWEAVCWMQGDRCNLDLVPGCMDPGSPMFDPLANVDDGSCPPYSDSEDS